MKRAALFSLVGLLMIASSNVSKCADDGRNYAYWEPEISAYEQMDRINPPPQGALLFLGSSTIVRWTTLAQDFPEYPVINRGFGGSEIVDSTYFADRIIFPYRPRKVFLRAGIDDIDAGKSPEQVSEDFKAFVAEIHAGLPNTEIAFISLSPSIYFWSEAAKQKEANTLIQQFISVTPGVQYIETYDMTLGPDGKPRPELFVDTLHFNAAGYKLLADRVRPYLAPQANPAPQTNPPPSTAGRVDGNDSSVVYSGAYADYSGSQWYNGTMRLIDAVGGYAQLTFTGTSIKWVGVKQFNLGIADVYLDGVRIQAGIDTYDPGTVNAVELFSKTGLADTWHTIKVVETGSKNSSSIGSRIAVDYFESSSRPSSLGANNDAYAILENSILTVGAPGVLANDIDLDGKPLSAVLVQSAQHGMVSLNSDGSFTYTPTANYTGPDSLSYMANNGNDTSLATVSFTITPLGSGQVTITPQPVANDFNGDGLTDILLQNPDGFVGVWFMNNGQNLISASTFNPNNVSDPRWHIVGTGDFNNDKKTDILYQREDGILAVWYMDGINLISASLLNPSFPGDGWHAVATGDINGDNKRDIIFQHTNGTLAAWYMDGINLIGGYLLNPPHAGEDGWRVVGTAQLSFVGSVDLVFQHTDGTLAAWYMNGLNLDRGLPLNPDNPGDLGWKVAGTVDLNSDGKTDLLFQHDNGSVAVWFMNGINLSTATFLNPPNSGGSGWRIVGPK